MSESKSLINIGDFAEPVNTLIVKISEAIGGATRPGQIIRIARAEAEADKIRALSQIEIAGLPERAITRFVAEEMVKQQNMEAIVAKALPEVTQQAQPEQIENDWLANYFDKCRLITDDDMQDIWAKILAGEANMPGKYSKRTIDLVSSLDKSDAVLLAALCSFGFNFGTSEKIYPLIYNKNDKIYKDHGVHFNSIRHLNAIGLVQFDFNRGYVTRFNEIDDGIITNVSYFDESLSLKLPLLKAPSIKVGYVLLTKAGQQLAPICGAEPIEGFIDRVLKYWDDFGYKLVSIEE